MIEFATLQKILLAGGLCIAAVLLVLASLVDRDADRLRGRLQTVVRQTSGRDAPGGPQAPAAARSLRERGTALLQRVTLLSSRIPFLGRDNQDDIRRMLTRAGIRGNESVALYLSAKLLGFGAGALLAVAAVVILGTGIDVMKGLVYAGFAGFVGGVAPEFVVKRWVSARRAAIAAALPDALDLLIICANAGYSLDMSVQRVGREIARFFPELADEFTLLASEMQLLSDRREALDNLVERTDVPSVRSLVVTLLQAQRYGTPLTQALRTLAKEERGARIFALEERAARLPALISLPLMILIMPALFIVIAGPAVIDIMKGF